MPCDILSSKGHLEEAALPLSFCVGQKGPSPVTSSTTVNLATPFYFHTPGNTGKMSFHADFLKQTGTTGYHFVSFLSNLG